MGKKRNTQTMQTRTIAVSAVHPITATVVVRRDPPDGDWQIDSVRSCNTEVSVRSLTENMKDDDFAELERRANAAKDDE